MKTIPQLLPSSPAIDVPKVCSKEDIEQYVSLGYHIAPRLLNDDEIEEIKDDAPRLIRGDYGQAEEPIVTRGDESDLELISKVLCMHQPHFHSPIIEKYVKHPKICGILNDVVGAHLAHWQGDHGQSGVKCMQSMYFVKPPEFQGQAWHQDEIYIPTRDRSLTGAWIALDDATIENGCLWVLRGSHRSGVLYPQKPHGNPDEFDVSEQSYGFDAAAEIPVEVPKGSVVFFNGYLLHRSQKNRSDQFRRVLVNHYMSNASHLAWINNGAIARQDDRITMNVAGVDPYAYKGQAPAPAFHYRRRSSEP